MWSPNPCRWFIQVQATPHWIAETLAFRGTFNFPYHDGLDFSLFELEDFGRKSEPFHSPKNKSLIPTRLSRVIQWSKNNSITPIFTSLILPLMYFNNKVTKTTISFADISKNQCFLALFLKANTLGGLILTLIEVRYHMSAGTYKKQKRQKIHYAALTC